MTRKSDECVAAVLDSFPGPVTLQPVFWLRLAILAPAVVTALVGLDVAVTGYATTGEPDGMGMTLLAVCGAISLWLVLDLLPGNGLTLDADGFRSVMWHRRRSYTWAEVANFRAVHDGERHVVVFDLATGGGHRMRPDLFFDDELADLYGMTPDSLVLLMTSWQRRAMTASNPPLSARS